MKKIGLYLMLFAPIIGFGQSQNKKIQDLWNTIQQQDKDAEIKSMLPNVIEVKTLSKKAKDYPSLIKAMFFEARIAILTKEDKEYDINSIIKSFEAESKSSKGVQKAVIDTYIAMIYDMYYQANRYKIRNRTTIEGGTTSSDIAYWTTKDFTDKIDAQYKAALQVAEKSKTATIGEWNDIFTKEEISKLDWNKLSVYNLIQLEYLNFLLGNNYGADDYSTKQKEVEESLLNSLKQNKQTSLYLYVKLLLLNKSDGSYDDQKAIAKALLDEYPTETIVYDGYARYISGKELVELADKVQSLFPNTPIAERFTALKKDTEASQLSVQLKKYVLNDKHIPLHVNHTNASKIFVQAIRVVDENKLLDTYSVSGVEGYKQLVDKYNIADSYSIDLKSFDDYASHSTMVALNPLKTGRYYIVISDTPFDALKKGEVNLSLLDLNVTSNYIVDNEKKLRAYNSATGVPLANTDIIISNGPKKSNANTYWETVVKTDANGEYVFDFVNKPGFYFFNVKGEDVYFSKRIYNSYAKSDNTDAEKIEYRGVLMMDRAIYRPGQVVYFKTIVSQTKNNKEQVSANTAATAILYNANGDEIAKLSLTTNEFGSANGQFVLPNSGLLGDYSIEIEVDDSTIAENNFDVEEYKRPTFEATIAKPTATYKINDEVEVKGNARSFMGASLNNAKVTYRVERNEIWPYWYWKGVAPYRHTPVKTMVEGESVTDNEGNFTIAFKALPVEEKTEANNPRTYVYTVYADVTDVNGETHSVNETVVVGDKNINLDIALNGKVNEKDLSNFKITTKNLNDVDYPAKGELAIYAIDKPYTPRLLDGVRYGTTDYEVYDYDTFVAKLPYTEYANELDDTKWKEGKQVFTVSFDTASSKDIKFDGASKLPSGSYLIKGLVFENGEKNEFEQNFTLVNSKLTSPLTELIEMSIVDDRVYKSGEKAKVSLRAAENNTHAIVEVYANDKKVQSKTVVLGTKATLFEVPIKNEYKDVRVNVVALKNNISKVENSAIRVIAAQEDLKITVESFRDKIEPGAKEKWSLKIAGSKADNVAAEVLATMYDASLDQFRPNNFYERLKEPVYYTNSASFNSYNFYSLLDLQYQKRIVEVNATAQTLGFYNPVEFNLFNFRIGAPVLVRGMSSLAKSANQNVAGTFGAVPQMLEGKAAGVSVDNENSLDEVVVSTGYGSNTVDTTGVQSMSPRKNLKETAFFYPTLTLQTDAEGSVKVSFTMPEALTQWKFMAFAHTKDLRQGQVEQLVQTQKQLMVVPNLPRFLREGDKLTLSSKVVNMTDKATKGKATLTLLNAFTQAVIEEREVPFELLSKGTSSVSWDITVPNGVEAISCRVVASDGAYSDGEESVLAVLSNRIMVTETMPLAIKEGQNKLFTFDKYENEHSTSLDNYKLTFELTTNPVWNAIFALPSLQESKSTNVLSMFSNVFANAVSTQILNSNPTIKTVFEQWASKDQMTSKLEQNEELKNILIEETPWLKQAESESEQMKRLAVLFDLNKMHVELDQAMKMLKEQQNTDGGFPWYSGGVSDQYITQTVIEGFGNLQKMGVLDTEWMEDLDVDYDDIVSKAIDYTDAKLYAAYQKGVADGIDESQAVTNMHYMYARSYFLSEYKIKEQYAPMIAAMRKQIEGSKGSGSLYQQAMRATIAQRFGFTKEAQSGLKAIFETAVLSETDGMYWKDNSAGWRWYQAPVETQVAIIEAANEIDKVKYANEIEEMKVWLLKNKQATGWSSSKATTKAIYALLNTGKVWADTPGGIEVKVGGYPLDITKDSQMGSGYFKKSWSKDQMTAKQGVVELTKTTPGISYGAMYWQYFEDLNKVSKSDAGIQMTKELYVKTNTANGQVLKAITTNDPIQIGDVVTVRLTLQVDQNMNYVHLKDMRASGFEPTNVFSGYKWKGEFSYYEETRDAATNFFISSLRKGTYVFEYDLRANVSGTFSNGITTIQNMYAPEMNAHSQGSEIQIK